MGWNHQLDNMEFIPCHYENPVFAEMSYFQCVKIDGPCLLWLLALMNAVTTHGAMNEALHFLVWATLPPTWSQWTMLPFYTTSRCLKYDRILSAFQNHRAHKSTSHCLNVLKKNPEKKHTHTQRFLWFQVNFFQDSSRRASNPGQGRVTSNFPTTNLAPKIERAEWPSLWGER